jgi:nucleoside-diphosphate-sugar epimerase
VAFDAMRPSGIRDVLRAVQPAIAFNLVGYGVDRTETSADVMERVNHHFVRQLAAGLVELPASTSWSGMRLVHVGSALEYGLASGVIGERTTPVPHTDYGRTKLEGTLAVGEIATGSNLPSVVARAFTVFGPGEHEGRLLPTIRGAAASGGTVHLSSGAQRRDFGYVEDVAEGLLRLGLSSGQPGEIVNLASGRLTTVREFATAAAAVLGLSADRLEFGKAPVRLDEMRIDGVDVGRFRERTGWSLPADLERLFRRCNAFEAAGPRQ